MRRFLCTFVPLKMRVTRQLQNKTKFLRVVVGNGPKLELMIFKEFAKTRIMHHLNTNSLDLYIQVSFMIVWNFTMLLVLNWSLRFSKKERAVDQKRPFLAGHLWRPQKSELYAIWTKCPPIIDSGIFCYRGTFHVCSWSKTSIFSPTFMNSVKIRILRDMN